MKSLSFRIPMRAVTSQNARFLNPFARAAIVKRERKQTAQAFIAAGGAALNLEADGRYLVKLVRIGPNELDDDNLAGTLKAVRDEIAAQLGVNDRDPRIRFWPEQRSEGHVKAKNPKTGKTSKVGVFAVEVMIHQQACEDCFVEHCDCTHAEWFCDGCQAFTERYSL